MVNDKIDDGKQSTSSAGHFDRHGGAPVRYEAHLQMWHAHGYFGSHWTPPSDDYSLRIAPVAARVTINKTTMQNNPPFAGHSDGRGGVPVLHRAHHPMEEVHGFPKSH